MRIGVRAALRLVKLLRPVRLVFAANAGRMAVKRSSRLALPLVGHGREAGGGVGAHAPLNAGGRIWRMGCCKVQASCALGLSSVASALFFIISSLIVIKKFKSQSLRTCWVRFVVTVFDCV